MLLEDCPLEPKFCIIGAGFAGLRAARHFEQLGVDYLILEGSDRVGGRVYPFEYREGYLQYGAEYINGVENEVYGIAKKLGLLAGRTEDLWMLDESTITVVDGEKVDGETMKVFRDFVRDLNETLYLESETLSGSAEDRIEYHLSQRSAPNPKTLEKLCKIYKNYFQTEWSSPINELSLANLSLWDDGTDAEDSAVLNHLGFQKILEDLKSRIPKERIRLNSKVLNVHYSGPLVHVELSSGEVLSFDSVLVTSSLGYLKSHHGELFSPKLPRGKQDAIERMGYGSNLKVFLEYEGAWWPRDTSTIMICCEGEMEDFMVFQPSSWAENILTCWIAGNGPSLMAEKPDSEVQKLLDHHLKTHLTSLAPPESLRVLRKDWITDEFALGSYSYLTPGQDKRDILTLGEPILREGGRPLVCFAGEHTDPTMYQTTVGAARSGLREAIRMTKAFCE
uniref:Amino_oxidase domain-containing protein n=1 Tax=Caenorhabditis tropicalis TaxID=1561998 RepID=A0A1I7V2N6_9PELO